MKKLVILIALVIGMCVSLHLVSCTDEEHLLPIAKFNIFVVQNDTIQLGSEQYLDTLFLKDINNPNDTLNQWAFSVFVGIENVGTLNCTWDDEVSSDIKISEGDYGNDWMRCTKIEVDGKKALQVTLTENNTTELRGIRFMFVRTYANRKDFDNSVGELWIFQKAKE